MTDKEIINQLKKQLPEGYAIVPTGIDREVEKIGWEAYNSTMDMYYIYSDMIKAASKRI